MKKKLAFCLYKYFPHGGLQRDMLRLALACRARGHGVDVYTTSWQGDVPEGLRLHVRPARGWTNHGRMKRYHAWVTEQLAKRPAACVVGFNKMPDLDVYFAADGCFQAKATERRGWLYRLGPRYRQYLAFEEAVFGTDARTHILTLTQSQEASYARYYATAADRIHRLPPNMAPGRMVGLDVPKVRQAYRQKLGAEEGDRLLLQVASSFQTKGVDRSIRALASLPESIRTRLYVAGDDVRRPCRNLARRLGVADRVMFLGPRDDVPQLLVAADLLVHPAREEAAGIVLLEALAGGLPVIVGGACGHAHYVERATAGWVLDEPFDQKQLNAVLNSVLERTNLRDIGKRGSQFAQRVDLCGMADAAVEIIDAVANHRNP